MQICGNFLEGKPVLYLTTDLPNIEVTFNSEFSYSFFGKIAYYLLHNNASFHYSLSRPTFHFLQISSKVISPVLEYIY